MAVRWISDKPAKSNEQPILEQKKKKKTGRKFC